MAVPDCAKTLFVKGNTPMLFWMRPSLEKERIKRLIEYGGGQVVSKLISDAIRLAEPNSKVLSDGVISTRYIVDCVEANALLDISKYRVSPRLCDDISDFSDAENPPVYYSKRVRKSVQQYTRKEDEIILQWICDNRRYSEVKGRKMWQMMERSEVLKDRTWQSMKEHFVKKILPNLEHFNKIVTAKQKNRFKMTYSNEHNNQQVISGSSDNENYDLASRIQVSMASNSDRLYKYKEDVAILHFILKAKSSFPVRGNMIWRMMEDRKITNHSWQSMKERFLKRIIKNLSQYALNTVEYSKIFQRAGMPADHNEPLATSSPLCQKKNRRKKSKPSKILETKTFDDKPLGKKKKLFNTSNQPIFDKQASCNEETVNENVPVKRTQKMKKQRTTAQEINQVSERIDDQTVISDKEINLFIDNSPESPDFGNDIDLSPHTVQEKNNFCKDNPPVVLSDALSPSKCVQQQIPPKISNIPSVRKDNEVSVISPNLSKIKTPRKNRLKKKRKTYSFISSESLAIESSSDSENSFDSFNRDRRSFRSILDSGLTQTEPQNKGDKCPRLETLAQALSDVSDGSEIENNINCSSVKITEPEFLSPVESTDEDEGESVRSNNQCADLSMSIQASLKNSCHLNSEEIKNIIKCLVGNHPETKAVLMDQKFISDIL